MTHSAAFDARASTWTLPAECMVSTNFSISAKNHTVEGYLFNRDRLVITFEPDMPQNQSAEFRAGWGSTALRKRGVSHICVKCEQPDWFQAPDLAALFLKLQPFLKSFGSRVTYGASMGGFAALAYADLIGADQIFAFDPQSTLHRPSVPFEKRFLKAYGMDFTGPYGSAVGKFTKAREAIVFLDKYCKEDRAHAKALETPSMRLVNVPFSGHGAAYAVTAAKCMGIVLDGVVSGTFDAVAFYRRLRSGRRSVDRYQANLRARVKDRSFLRSIVESNLPTTA